MACPLAFLAPERILRPHTTSDRPLQKAQDEAGAWLSTACEDDRRSRSAGVSAIEALPRSSS
jgi:hypothetical protein